MFLHIVAVDKQYSVQADDKKPLSDAIAVAFNFHRKRRSTTQKIKSGDGKTLSASKTPKANGLADNDMVYVGLKETK